MNMRWAIEGFTPGGGWWQMYWSDDSVEIQDQFDNLKKGLTINNRWWGIRITEIRIREQT